MLGTGTREAGLARFHAGPNRLVPVLAQRAWPVWKKNYMLRYIGPVHTVYGWCLRDCYSIYKVRSIYRIIKFAAKGTIWIH